MSNTPTEPVGESPEYIVVPEALFAYLPPEYRDGLSELKAEGESYLAVVDDNIERIMRMARVFPAMASLRYIHSRLASAEFSIADDVFLEHDMLTLAFVVAYARLVDSSHGTGVTKSKLPEHLRSAHDEIMELRRARYAHNGEHKSVSGGIEIGFEGGEFDINVWFSMGTYIRGANEWAELVAKLDEIIFLRLQAQLDEMKQKTGREWKFRTGPAPAWIDHAGEEESA